MSKVMIIKVLANPVPRKDFGDIAQGVWFTATQHGESRLFLRAYNTVVDIEHPHLTYDGGCSFKDFQEVNIIIKIES